MFLKLRALTKFIKLKFYKELLTKILTQSKVCATLNFFKKILKQVQDDAGGELQRRHPELVSGSQSRIVFGLGSNLGDRNFYLDEAVLELTQQLFLSNSKTSAIFRNPAMLLPNSPKEWDVEFFNIAFSADINLQKFSPEKILETVKKIEKNLGRKERERWAPREIDIDILLIEGVKIELGEKLTIPHRDLFNRDFFVKTVEEIEPLLLKMVG